MSRRVVSMKRGDAGWGDRNAAIGVSRTAGRRSRALVLTGVAAGAMLVGSTMMPTIVAAEGAAKAEVVVEASVTAPSVAASANCVGSDSWAATWVVSSNAGDSGSWQLNAGALQSTASNFVIEETHNLNDESASFAATVSFDGGAQGRPVSASIGRPDACISAPPPSAPAPDVETEPGSQLATSNIEAVDASPSVVSSSNCSGSDDWAATWVISSNAGNSGSWQLDGGSSQSTDIDFVVEKIYPLDNASALLVANVSYEGGPQAVEIEANADRPTACILAAPPVATVPAVEVFAPAAVASPSSAGSPTPGLAQTLPATGNETTVLALLALASVSAGLLLIGASRRRTTT